MENHNICEICFTNVVSSEYKSGCWRIEYANTGIGQIIKKDGFFVAYPLDPFKSRTFPNYTFAISYISNCCYDYCKQRKAEVITTDKTIPIEFDELSLLVDDIKAKMPHLADLQIELSGEKIIFKGTRIETEEEWEDRMKLHKDTV